MADEIKFTDEELKSLQDLSQSYQNIQASFGQLKVQKILNQQQADALEEAEVKMDADYKDIQDNERKLVEELNEKYGPGQLDPQTGVFTPAPPQEEAAEEVEQS
jgi:DNA repair exonuclease SbcCD ATPase subunit|tara:strand:- start:2063 stop:2374 length:312 start_codon:yes stop_codon:yes gene_type:complete